MQNNARNNNTDPGGLTRWGWHYSLTLQKKGAVMQQCRKSEKGAEREAKLVLERQSADTSSRQHTYTKRKRGTAVVNAFCPADEVEPALSGWCS